jgi:hypothetical protein
VTTLNNVIVKEPEDKINIEVLRTIADKTVTGPVSYLVNMAKAEAFECLGRKQGRRRFI